MELVTQAEGWTCPAFSGSIVWKQDKARLRFISTSEAPWRRKQAFGTVFFGGEGETLAELNIAYVSGEPSPNGALETLETLAAVRIPIPIALTE